MNAGKLYVIATPIGNLGDISLRALTVLKEVALIAAEDTRQSKKLLDHYAITTPLISLHAHNERARAQKMIDRLRAGENVAYITDAGTPVISDPGSHLVASVRQAHMIVSPVPGPCAAIAALSASGLPGQRFIFHGFLPVKTGERKRQLEALKAQPITLLFYESPHRLLSTIKDMIFVFGENRYGVIARELTKKFETLFGASLGEIQEWLLQNTEQQKGEFVILIQGSDEIPTSVDRLENLLRVLLDELPMKQAVVLASKISGEPKNKVYQMALKLLYSK